MTGYDVGDRGRGGWPFRRSATAFGDPALARYSFGAMKELREELNR